MYFRTPRMRGGIYYEPILEKQQIVIESGFLGKPPPKIRD